MGKKLYDLILYRVLTNPYIRFVNPATGEQADFASKAMNSAATWTDTVFALSFDNNIGGMPVAIPNWLPAGSYDLLIYDSDSPAYTDEVDMGKRISWSGKDLIGLPLAL
jgi:hypothetical protein